MPERTIESRLSHDTAGPVVGARRVRVSAAGMRCVRVVGALLLALAIPGAARAQQDGLPPATKPAATPSTATTPATTAAPSVVPSGAAAPGAERCLGCHAQLTQKRVVHSALEKNGCQACHRADAGAAGKCKAKTAQHWTLVRTEPELCYGCHARKDQSKSVHTAVRQGSCLSCHTAHASDEPALLTSPREKICFDCHELEPLVTKAVKHAPVAEGRCLDCHDAHGGSLPNAIKAESGSAFCLKCHDAKAPVGKGTPGPAYRVDLSKATVHVALKRGDCTTCHDGGHSGDNLKLLKKNAVDLCYSCHERKDKAKYPHSAVVVGDCAVCHDPHSSNQPKLLAKATIQETCFICHQDDLTGRKVVHAPVAKGCDQCHDAHGAQNRNALKIGEGKDACYKCHKPVDTGKYKHAALERYGCTGCHDPHGASNAAMLGPKVNALCVGCHDAQKDPMHVTPLAAKGHPIGGALVDPKRAGRGFSCASCHNPHGSNSPKFFYVGETPMDSCAWCHGDKSGQRPELKNVVSKARRSTLDAGAGGGGDAGAGGGVTNSAPVGGGITP